jgi:NosR/NirI family nitrous oxide reductase transcriptional regulator
VQSIHPEGFINVNECIYCMHCQVLYHDDQRCPHMIQLRLKRERRAALSSPSMRQDKEAGGKAAKPITTEQGMSDAQPTLGSEPVGAPTTGS